MPIALPPNRSLRRQDGYVFIFFIVAVLLLIGYGMVAFKSSVNSSEKAELNLLIVSALNAASNAAPSPSDMFRAACNTVATEFPLDNGTDCAATSFAGTPPSATFNELRIDGTKRCDITFTFSPLSSSDVNTFCVNITNCDDQQLIIPGFLTPALYQTGSSGCIGKKSDLGYLLVDYSSAASKIFRQDNPTAAPGGFSLPPSFLTLPAANYNGFAPDTYNEIPRIQNAQLPGVYDDVLGVAQIPAGNAYKAPFATKETKNSVTPLGRKPNLDTRVAVGQYRNSLPDVAPYPGPIAPDNLPDPIQFIPKIASNWYMWKWALSHPTSNNTTQCSAGAGQPACNYRWRHGHITQWELANWCFGPLKLVVQRTAQHAANMLNFNGAMFGLAAVSNWINPILPLPNIAMRTDLNSPLLYGPYLQTMPVLGPIGTWTGNGHTMTGIPDLIEEQFGDSSHVGTWLDRTTQARFLQGMSICAREMRAVVNSSSTRHYFTSLADPYYPTRPVVPPVTSSCPNAASSPYLNPMIENYYTAAGGFRYQFMFNKDAQCCTATYLQNGTPLSSTFYDSTEPCRTGAPYFWPGGAAFPPPPIDSIIETPASCNPLVDANYGDIREPYRWCLPDESQWPDGSNALGALRAGAFSKSGYPLHLGFSTSSHVANMAAGVENRYLSGVHDAANVVYPYTTDVIVGGGDWSSKDAATPLASWIAFKTLTDTTNYVANPELESRFILAFLVGAPTLSIEEALANQYQAAVFSAVPPSSKLPTFGIDTTVNGKKYTRAVRETLHIFHSAAELGIKVFVILLDAGNTDSGQIDHFTAGLKKPVGDNGMQAGSGKQYNFCKSGAQTQVLVGSAPEPVATGTCDPVYDPDAYGIAHMRITKGLTETFTDFATRVYTESSIFIREHILAYSLKK